MIQKILIIRFSSIGDIVLTTPVIRMLKMQTGAQLHYLTKPGLKSIIDNNPYLDKIITLPNNESELRPILKKENYDIIIDLHHNLRSRRFSFLLSKKVFRVDKLNFRKWLLVQFKFNTMPNKHIVDRYLNTCKLLNILNDNQGLDYFHGLDLNELNKFDIAPNKYIVYAIGGQHYTKKMPLHKIENLLESIKGTVVLLGGKEDEAIADNIKTSINVINLCGKTTLNQSALIIEHAKKVITHDSGMMHIAAAYKKEIITIWGNTVPELGMFPYLTQSKLVQFEVPNLKCRPCSKIGFKSCPKSHFNCMNLQDIEAISEAIND